jgi:predicted ThiF/HesA family dinucleotide-utilizing enzyme
MNNIKELENKKVPKGEVSLVGLGRLGLRTALNLIQAHRGGPKKIYVIDGQRISIDDIIFRMYGGEIGEYKVDFIKRIVGDGFNKEIIPVSHDINSENMELVKGDVVCLEIAGGDTLNISSEIIKNARSREALTISTMGVFGIGEEEIIVENISDLDIDNPIVEFFKNERITDHLLVGTGKLIRDWEPVTPYTLDKISEIMTAEILKLLEKKNKATYKNI